MQSGCALTILRTDSEDGHPQSAFNFFIIKISNFLSASTHMGSNMGVEMIQGYEKMIKLGIRSDSI